VQVYYEKPSRQIKFGGDCELADYSFALIKALRKMPLRPAAMAAAIEEIEKERRCWHALKLLADERVVHDSREAMRRLLVST
jgi:hypothetical protein